MKMTIILFIGLALLAGVHSASQSNRIIGGSPATIEQYPSIVQVESISSSNTWNQECGATIITNLHVLSAAHCFETPGGILHPSERRIRAGTNLRHIGGTVVYVENYINHPNYQAVNPYDSDISVVRLSSALVWSNVIQPIAIIQQGGVLPDNTPVVPAGWGFTTPWGPASDVLLDVTVYTINSAVCSSRYPWGATSLITENMICAGLLDVGGADACSQDSGGPLYYSNNNQNILYGVTSFGMGCGYPEFPGVSVRVAAFTNWIIATAV